MKSCFKSKTYILLILILVISINIIFFQYIPYSEVNSKSIMDENPKLNASDITIITPENKTYTEPMSGYYLATFGFENDMDGETPNMWEIDDTYGSVRVIEELDGHKKVLELEDTSNLGEVVVNQTFALQQFGTVELWWRVNDTSKRAKIVLTNSILKDAVVTLVWSGDLDRWQYFDGSWKTVPNIPNPLASTWYRMIIDFERTTENYQGLGQNKWNVNFNGVNSGQLNLRINEDVDTITILTSQAIHQDLSFYIDAVGFSWDPNYNRGDNFYEGLLLTYQNSITFDWMGYSLDGQANKTILGNSTFSFPQDGLHFIQVLGNSSLGTMYQSDIRHFSIDTIPPIINITNPIPDEYFGSLAPDFQITINEVNLNTTWYTIDNGITNITFSGLTGSINQTEWNKKGDIMVTIRFYANDSWGFEGYSEVNIYKDTTTPVSSIDFAPYSGINEVIKSTIFTIIADDGLGSGVSIIQYKINDSSWFTYTEPFDLSAYDYGDYLITFRAIDNVDNIETENTELVTLIKEPSEPPVIYGYELWILVGIISIASIAIIYKEIQK